MTSFKDLPECLRFLQQERALEDTTIEAYRQTIQWLATKLNENPMGVPYWLVGRQDAVISTIKNHYKNPQSIRSRLSPILSFVAYVTNADNRLGDKNLRAYGIYNELAKQCKEENKQLTENRNATEPSLNWNEITTKAKSTWNGYTKHLLNCDEVTEEDLRKIMRGVVSTLATVLPTRRQTDYHNLQIVRNKQSTDLKYNRKNYLNILSNGNIEFIYGLHKTVKKNGPTVLTISPSEEEYKDFVEGIKKWADCCENIQHQQENKWLFFEEKNGVFNHWKRPQITDALYKTLGAGIRDIRSSLITHYNKDQIPLRKKRHFAAMMGHSVAEHENTYRREEEEEEEFKEDEVEEIEGAPIEEDIGEFAEPITNSRSPVYNELEEIPPTVEEEEIDTFSDVEEENES